MPDGERHHGYISRLSHLQFQILVALILQGFFVAIVSSMLGPFFPVHAKTLGLSRFEIGTVFSVFSFTMILSGPVFGHWASRIGKRRLLVIGIIVECVCSILFGFSSLLWEFLVLRGIQGVGSAAASTAAFAMLGDHFPHSLGVINGIIETLIGIGFMLGPPLGGWLFELGGFGLPFVGTGLAGFVMLSFVACLLPSVLDADSASGNHIPAASVAEKDDRDANVSYRPQVVSPFRVLSSVETAVTAGVIVMMSMAFGVLDSTLALHLQEELGISTLDISACFFANSTMYTLFAPISGYIADHTHLDKLTMASGILILAVSNIGLGAWPKHEPVFWWMIVVCAVFGLGGAFSFIPSFPDMVACTYRLIRNRSEFGGARSRRISSVDPSAIDTPDSPPLPHVHHSLDVIPPVAGLHTTLYAIGQIVGPLLGPLISHVTGSFSLMYFIFGGSLGLYGVLIVGPFVVREVKRVRRHHPASRWSVRPGTRQSSEHRNAAALASENETTVPVSVVQEVDHPDPLEEGLLDPTTLSDDHVPDSDETGSEQSWRPLLGGDGEPHKPADTLPYLLGAQPGINFRFT